MPNTKQDTTRISKENQAKGAAWMKDFRERAGGGYDTVSLSSRKDTVKVSDKTKQSLMPDWVPDRNWIRRAIDKNTPVTSKRETIQTASKYHDELGKEILFPTIRMVNGKLKRFKTINEAMDEAVKKKDFISFQTPEEATEFSIKLSKYVGEARGMD